MEKAFNLYTWEGERPYLHDFYYSILLQLDFIIIIVIVNLLLYLLYELALSQVCMYREKYI